MGTRGIKSFEKYDGGYGHLQKLHHHSSRLSFLRTETRRKKVRQRTREKQRNKRDQRIDHLEEKGFCNPWGTEKRVEGKKNLEGGGR